jgi:hypothetical protein
MATTSPALGPRLSALEAAGEAVEYTKRQLFPFQFDRWLALGFVAFLDQCGRAGGGGGGGGNGFRGSLPGRESEGSSLAPELSRATEWLGSHLALVAGIAVFVLVVLVAVSALVVWLSSRGIFMYVDNVATGRAEVVRPWHEHRDRAHSLFVLRFAVAMAQFAGMLLLAGLAGLLGYAYWKSRLGGGVALAMGLLGLLPLLLLLIVAGALVSIALRDFAAPLQWRLGVPCREALDVVGGLVRAHPGSFAAYVGLKIAFALTAAVIGLVAGCLTCCCGFLPVVSQTLLQPLFYFERAWSLFFLRQLGHDVFVPATDVSAVP